MKQIKCFFCIILILCLATSLCISAFSVEDGSVVIASGNCGAQGDNLIWTLSGDGTLTISGTGDMANFEQDAGSGWAPWWRNGSYEIRKVLIQDGVTSIGSLAFAWRQQLESVVISNSVKRIGGLAFSGCVNLTSVTIPNSVTTIEDQAFEDCNSLTDVYYNGNESQWKQMKISSIRNDPLLNANIYYSGTEPEKRGTCGDNLTWVLENETLTISGTGDMQGYWFPLWELVGDTHRDNAPWSEYGVEITNVVIQSGVTSIGDRAFFGCNVSNVSIPDSVTSIGYGAFEQTRLTDVYYGGDETGWQNVSISYMDYRNERLRNATIHYNSAVPAPSTSGDVSVTVGGKTVVWTDAEPFIDANSRTMVPLRAVADAMGLDANWNATTREASFTNGSKTISFPIDSATARISGGGTVQMDTAAVIVNERTYAPIRYLAEFFDYHVDWDAAVRNVLITS